MKKIDVLDFENMVIEKFVDEDKFKEFLSTDKIELNLDFSDLKSKGYTDEDLDEYTKEEALDYLEEQASIVMIENPKNRDEIIMNNLPTVASISFYYTRENVCYLDVVQEGSLGLIKAIDEYNEKIHGEFENYKYLWIIREIVLFIQSKIEDMKNEFKSYFKNRKDNFGHDEEHDEEEDLSGEIILKVKDLLPTIEAIEKKEKAVEDSIVFSKIYNRLSLRQIDVLNYYFGFGVERRFSIYEIEEKLNLKSGDGEKIFIQALNIVSTVEGKRYL